MTILYIELAIIYTKCSVPTGMWVDKASIIWPKDKFDYLLHFALLA